MGINFHDRVPEEADIGSAKVTLLLPDSKKGNVVPATFEVPVVGAEK
jgi:hypothetical protein